MAEAAAAAINGNGNGRGPLIDGVPPGVPLPEEGSGELWGVLAEFSDPGALSHAAQATREAGYKKYDTHSSYPVHEMDERMGLGLSNVTYFTGAGALAGVTIAILMQWWMSAIDYPIVVGGKPLSAWEQFTPIIFELGVLLAAISTIVGMFLINGLPRHHHPLLQNRRFVEGAHDDKLFLVIEARDKSFDERGTPDLLERLGATHIEMVEA